MREAAEQRRRISGSPKPSPRLLDQREHGPAEPEHAEDAADEVDPRARPAAAHGRESRSARARSSRAASGRLIRKIERQEATEIEPAADERADQERDPVHAVQLPDRRAAFLAAEHRRDRRERGRVEQRPGDSLQRPRDDQRRPVPGERAEQRGGAERGDARSRTRAVRRTGRRATRRPGSASRASAGRRRPPIAAGRARRRDPA